MVVKKRRHARVPEKMLAMRTVLSIRGDVENLVDEVSRVYAIFDNNGDSMRKQTAVLDVKFEIQRINRKLTLVENEMTKYVLLLASNSTK